MPNRDAILWFKQNFHREIGTAVAGTPFTIDMLAAIASQETGFIWDILRKKSGMSLGTLLELCVGDTLDADKGRSAFPKTKADLVAAPRGGEMFKIAHEALGAMAAHIPGYSGVAKKAHKFCHGYGIFQYDLQFYKRDPDYFLEKRWADFDACLAKCIGELHEAMKRMGIAGRTTLTDLERVHVAIAYNAGSFRPAKGLKQGHFNGSKFYGELIFDFQRISMTVPTSTLPPLIPITGPGRAPVLPPTPPTATGKLFEVDVKTSPLRLRREPKIDKTNPTGNVIGRLPDGHRVRLVSGKRSDEFLEIETSLAGALLRGFAASEFLVPIKEDAGADEIPVIAPDPEPPTSGIVAVFAPRKAGHVTKRTDNATAHSLNESGAPKRAGDTPEDLRSDIADIIDYLAVDKSSHARYQPRSGFTFCNIYVHDFCHLGGVYIPRVWWTPDAIERLAKGESVEPRLASTIDEQRANDIFRWLLAFGARFGWRQTGSLTKLQTEANAGAIGLIVARRTNDGRPGHIVMVVPETSGASAKRDSSGEVTAPLQSQAGSRNFRRSTGGPSWWTGSQFAESAFWIHA
jgi:hypothetical protein